MRFTRGWAGSLVVLAALMPGLAMAADATLTLLVGGEGFDGPPKFAVSFAGHPVGDGVVDSAIDTTKAGRFADAGDKGKYVQNFNFKIPEAAFKPDGEVRIKLTNEAHGAAGSKDDRQIYVQSVAVNGTALEAAQLGMRSAVGTEPTAMLGDYLVISQAAVEAVAKAPTGGWPKTDTASAEAPVHPAEPAPAVAAAEVAPADAAPAAAKPASTGTDKAVVEPAAVVPAEKPAATKAIADATPATNPAPVADAPAVKVAEATAADSADANPDPEAGAVSCGLSKSFQITGFSENSNDLTPRVNRQLDAVAKAIGEQKCVVHLTGYSSTEGDFAHNALFSIERAQNALHYLTAKGVKFRRFSANGVGETRQFGPNPNANRRVVVVVSP